MVSGGPVEVDCPRLGALRHRAPWAVNGAGGADGRIHLAGGQIGLAGGQFYLAGALQPAAPPAPQTAHAAKLPIWDSQRRDSKTKRACNYARVPKGADVLRYVMQQCIRFHYNPSGTGFWTGFGSTPSGTLVGNTLRPDPHGMDPKTGTGAPGQPTGKGVG